ncbi:MAG: DinB family protein [Ignavibacteriae bacterium]|nr:MAG: DinB family protein [Ignavibacteriota bacterium]
MKTAKEIQIYLQLLGESYDQRAWQGTNLKGSLRGLTVQEAAWRPAPGRHNIWEIVIHAAYWKYIVRRRLLGEKKGSFPLNGSNWIKRPMVLRESAWREDVRLLDEVHHSMCEAIASLKPSDLNRSPAGSKFSNAALILGIASHDVYHTGQIQLLKRLMKQ